MTYRRQMQMAWLIAALPALVCFALLIGPLALAVRTACTDAMGQPTLAHIRWVLGDPLFRRSLGYSLLVPGVGVALEAVWGLGLALWFHRLRHGRGFWRSIAILPFAMPEIVYLLTMKLMFRQHGYLNSLLYGVGGESAMVGWLESGPLMVAVVILVDAWRVTPVVFLIVLAALERIPTNLLEAGQLDGAGAWQMRRHILIPLVLPALGIAVALRSIDAFRIFATPLVLVGIEPLPVLTTVAYHYQADAHRPAAANVAALSLTAALAIVLGLGLLGTRLRRSRA